MEKTWFRWERSIKKNKWGSKSNNPYHSYYFATPITAKWTNIFNKIIRERILVKLSEFITDRDEIELCLNEIINTMKKIETLSRKKIKIYKRLQQETDDFLGVKGINYLESKIKKIKKFQKKDGMFLPFGFADYILSDFDSFMRPMDDIKFVLFSRLLNKLGTLHYLLNQRIKIISILDYEFKKENFVEPNEYLKNLTSS
nr:hypothetical protein [Candidatus Woesearchaeota archaeon]